ncbi:MAG: hypothetical protein ND895_03125 [Pyrinomonadaceae bacterium]|nr:hypothetical protein [Pyrinomonadaceae bacterium]
MKLVPLAVASLVISIAFVSVQAQSPEGSEPTRPRTVSSPVPQSEKTQQAPAQTVPQPQQTPEPVQSPNPQPSQTPSSPAVVQPQSMEPAGTEAETVESQRNARPLSPQEIRARISEAERLFKSRPMPTSMAPSIQYVTLAALDQNTRIHHVTLLKETFLAKGSEFQTTSSLGMPLNIRVLRANGVNTAVTVFDSQGRSLTPLLVEFPIEKKGVFRELAYYTSAHPALLSPELSRTGQLYVRSMLDLAAKRLHEKGVFISPQIMDVAERLCLVEHVDHERFRQEDRGALYQEIYSLFALNEIDTYRYSVSTAGAGGMVQMIPWTYNLMKQRHSGVGLIPDFVIGMRNHGNALQAMLLYMQDTWNDLVANDEVQYALNAKLATQTELLAAGYNSNAARLPGYLKRGGSSWRILIPRETQMYLQIYKSFEALVPMKPRPTVQTPSGNTGAGSVN